MGLRPNNCPTASAPQLNKKMTKLTKKISIAYSLSSEVIEQDIFLVDTL